MEGKTVQASRIWGLARRQHGVVSRRQLLALGLSGKAIEQRVARGRLHRVWQGVYAVGRPDVPVHGRLMGAVLACGPNAVLSHRSAGWLLGLGTEVRRKLEVSVPAQQAPRKSGLRVHRRATLREDDVTQSHGIPVTTPVSTLVDLAVCLSPSRLERAVNEADRLDLTNPEALRAALDRMPRRPGVGILRALLDIKTFTLTDSQLERLFLPIARQAGLPAPETGSEVNGYRVDFYWPHLGLVVETDGLRYHRTPGQQAKDRIRDQVHTAAGLTPVRFTRAQVKYERAHVRATLEAVARHLLRRRPE
jgi:very-short-patch-repair endonuclease